MRPQHLRAAVLERTGQPLGIRRLEVPPLQPGQVLVKILFSGVCRSQLMEARGRRGNDPWLPHMLGHEGSGTVVAIGDGVTKVTPGDEVILGWIKGDGIDAPGAIYRDITDGTTVNAGRVTTFSNYAIVAESRVTPKPPDLPHDAAVLYGCALPTGAGMVLNELRPGPDEKVVVLGLGGIGIAALIALIALGVRNVIAADAVPEKRELALRLGAAHALDPASENFTEQITTLTGGGADACIESAGSARTIELGFALIRKAGGRLLFASHPPEGELIQLTPHDLICGKRIAGSWGGGCQPDHDIPRLATLAKSAAIPMEHLLGRHYRLEEVNEALADLEAGRVWRPLLVMEHDDMEL